jgi:hypothetical protein
MQTAEKRTYRRNQRKETERRQETANRGYINLKNADRRRQTADSRL